MAEFSRDNTLQDPELALHLAAHKNDTIKLRALSENCDLERDSPICPAYASQHSIIFQADLCAWRAMDTDEVDTALFLGAVRWEDDVIQALLQGGKATQEGLDEALLKAASHRIMLTECGLAAVDMRPQKQGRVIELLLDAGARIDTQQPVSGNTALHISASSPDTIGAVRVLLERGADVHIKNKKGETAIAGAMVRLSNNLARFIIRTLS
ncbi:hypothetical protein FQN49_007877 [Arthroderma sp. PD_2]|nr:hypothetical protein FQN49_007877 [Arthroderma sp. PD_2]